MSQALAPGDPAPGFSLPTNNGGQLALKDLKGKKVALYFYPKDDTPGCTREAIDFTAHGKAFEKAGAVVVGASKDSPQKHDKFALKHKLDLVLVSDEDGKLMEDYGVWVEKKLYGRAYMGTERATFLIDEEGRIARIWRKVKVKGHAEEVLEAVKSI